MGEYKSNSAIVADVAGLFSKAKTTIQAKAVQAQSSIKDLKRLQTLARQINLASVSLPKYNSSKRLQVIGKFIDQLDNIAKPKGCKASCDKLRNELLSLKEGIANGFHLTKSDLVITTVPTVMEVVQERLAYVNRLVEAAQKSMTGQESAVQEIERMVTEDNEVKKVLQQVDKESEKALQVVKKKPFVIARLPVVPLGILDKATAKSSGFEVSDLQGYLIFHNQLVIGLNKALIAESTVWGNRKKIKVSQILGDIIDMIELKTNQKYVLIDKRPYNSAKTGGMGISWYWVMPMKQANTFARLFKMGTRQGVPSVRLEGWGLAV